LLSRWRQAAAWMRDWNWTARDATLVVNLCVEPENEPWPCTRDLELTFSLVLNRELDRARVWTGFYTASGCCVLLGTLSWSR
jgi:hypothetical protein